MARETIYELPERAQQLRDALQEAWPGFQAGLYLLADIAEFTPEEQIAAGEFLFEAYKHFQNKVFTGAVGYLAQQKHVQKKLGMRNEWEILTEISGIERNQVKKVLKRAKLVDNSETHASRYAGIEESDAGSATDLFGEPEHPEEFVPTPTDAPVEVVFGDLYGLLEAGELQDAQNPGSGGAVAGGRLSGALAGGALAGGALDEGVLDGGAQNLGECSGQVDGDESWQESEESKAKRRAKWRVSKQRQRAADKERRQQAAQDPYKADVEERIEELLHANADALTEAGETFAKGVNAKLREIAGEHTDINGFNAAAQDFLRKEFPQPRASEEYIAENRGLRFKRNDQRTGYLVSGFVTNEDHQVISSLIKTNGYAMGSTRSEALRRIEQEHTETNKHADGKLCHACKVVREANASGKKLSFRKCRKQERDLDSLIYTLMAGAGEEKEILVEAVMIPELAYLDAEGKLRTGSALKFINFDEVLGFQGKRKIAVGCDARTGEPLVAGWIKPELNANRAIGLLTKGMVFSQYQTCCGEGCDEPFENCELHHLVPYAKNGPTTSRNLIPLCKKCHIRVRDLNESLGGVYYHRDDDGRIFAIDKDGERVIEQLSNSWIREHLESGGPVPVLVVAGPLPLKPEAQPRG